ncbi:MAG: VanW family protein [Actinobacteria bacterium]|nr:VanW family protein [Actinomycetota bacterium]
MKRSSAKSRKARARRRLRILIAVTSVVAVCLLALLIDSAMYYNKVHGGVTISGQQVAGLTRDEATAAVNRVVKEAQKKPATLVSGEKTWKVLPDDVGTKLDVAKAVSAAMDATRGSNVVSDLFHRLRLYFDHKDIPLQGTVDTAKMDELAAKVAEDVDIPPVNAGLAFVGTEVKVVEGQKGRVVDQAALRQQLETRLFALQSTKLTVPMVVKEPAIHAEDSEKAVAQAKIMIGGPLTLTYKDSSWKISSEQIAAYMDFAAEDQNGVAVLVPYLSTKKMSHFFDNLANEVDKAAIDASFKGDGNQAWVVPAVPGRVLDRVKTAEALTAASLKTAGRTAQVATKITQPDLTTDEADAMGITEKLAGYQTVWEGTPDRQTNVRITTQYASNVILAPGEIYNLDKQIGPRTEARGFKLAPGIVGAGQLEDVLGGGICQVATTLFNAAFEAGLDIVERRNHSLYIDHYPKGRDATVTADGPNLRFRNDTDHYILVRGASDGIKTTFVIYGTPDGRTISSETSDFYDVEEMTTYTYPYSKLGPGTTQIKTKGQTGQGITVTRVVKAADGSIIHKDTFYSTWKMIPREVWVGTGSTTTTKKPPTTTTTAKRPSSTTTATTGF